MYALECGAYDDAITWTPDGMSFIIIDPNIFKEKVLPDIFKEAKFVSFQRKVRPTSSSLIVIFPCCFSSFKVSRRCKKVKTHTLELPRCFLCFGSLIFIVKLGRWAFTRHQEYYPGKKRLLCYSHECFQRGNFALCDTIRCLNRDHNYGMKKQLFRHASPMRAATTSMIDTPANARPEEAITATTASPPLPVGREREERGSASVFPICAHNGAGGSRNMHRQCSLLRTDDPDDVSVNHYLAYTYPAAPSHLIDDASNRCIDGMIPRIGPIRGALLYERYLKSEIMRLAQMNMNLFSAQREPSALNQQMIVQNACLDVLERANEQEGRLQANLFSGSRGRMLFPNISQSYHPSSFFYF